MNIRPLDALPIFVGVVGIIFAFMFNSILGSFSILLVILGVALIVGAIIHIQKEKK